MSIIKNFFIYIFPSDFIVLCFALILSIVNLIFHNVVPHTEILLQSNFIMASFVFYIAYLDKKRSNRLIMFIHDWYFVPLIFLSFKEIYLMVKPIRVIDYDSLLISIDKLIFGTDITHVLDKIATPVLTEILQISYATFFLLPIILGIDLLRNMNLSDFHFATFLFVYGFFISYFGYFIFPAVGPRFYLYDFLKINTDLPGLFFTNIIRDFLNLGESLKPGLVNPIAFVQRDVFPSGHTDITLIAMFLSYKFKLKSRFFLIPNGVLLIFSTMYLRYHYGIDVIGGIIFMIFSVWSGKIIYNFWQRFRGKPLFYYPKK